MTENDTNAAFNDHVVLGLRGCPVPSGVAN